MKDLRGTLQFLVIIEQTIPLMNLYLRGSIYSTIRFGMVHFYVQNQSLCLPGEPEQEGEPQV